MKRHSKRRNKDRASRWIALDTQQYYEEGTEEYDDELEEEEKEEKGPAREPTRKSWERAAHWRLNNHHRLPGPIAKLVIEYTKVSTDPIINFLDDDWVNDVNLLTDVLDLNWHFTPERCDDDAVLYEDRREQYYYALSEIPPMTKLMRALYRSQPVLQCVSLEKDLGVALDLFLYRCSPSHCIAWFLDGDRARLSFQRSWVTTTGITNQEHCRTETVMLSRSRVHFRHRRLYHDDRLLHPNPPVLSICIEWELEELTDQEAVAQLFVQRPDLKWLFEPIYNARNKSQLLPAILRVVECGWRFDFMAEFVAK